MSQHDYVLDNDIGSNFRVDLNTALGAIATNNSGATEPVTMYAYQWWADTTTGLLKRRNSANTAWVTIMSLDSLTFASPTLTGTTQVAALTASGLATFNSNVGIGVAPNAAFALYTSGTYNDGANTMQFNNLGTGRVGSFRRSVASATRPVVSMIQGSATGGTQAVLAIQQADTGEVALGINTDGSISAYNFKVLDTGAFTANGLATLSGGATVTGAISATTTLKSGGYTVATLPAGTAGMRAYVTDATTPTWLAALTGGGAVVAPVFHNGTAWLSA